MARGNAVTWVSDPKHFCSAAPGHCTKDPGALHQRHAQGIARVARITAADGVARGAPPRTAGRSEDTQRHRKRMACSESYSAQGRPRMQANLRKALCRKMQRETGNETRMSGAQTRAEIIKYKRGSLCPIYAARSTAHVAGTCNVTLRARGGATIGIGDARAHSSCTQALTYKPPPVRGCGRRACTRYMKLTLTHI